jgi:AcrR family transcriptional regulator
MNLDDMPERRRQYRMDSRADAAEATRQRILGAATELFTTEWFDKVTLDAVATRSGVTVQTVLRRFGSKEGLLAAVGEQLRQQVEAQRGQAPVGDIAGAVANLFDHYESVGDLVLRALAQEGMHPPIRALTDEGRQVHAAWVTSTFAPQLDRLPAAARDRRLAQLTVLTDIFVWKLLRHDQRMARTVAEAALREMIVRLPGMGPPALNGGQDAVPDTDA